MERGLSAARRHGKHDSLVDVVLLRPYETVLGARERGSALFYARADEVDLFSPNENELDTTVVEFLRQGEGLVKSGAWNIGGNARQARYPCGGCA